MSTPSEAAAVDVVIVGGGPAGLSAALALGRARRRVVLVDGGTPRNARATEVHTFFTRDGTPPAEMRRVGREQLAPYATVTLRDALVTAVTPDGAGFVVSLADERIPTRKVLLAVGVVDLPPTLDGMDRHWGRSVFQCPYCHGFERRDRPWGVLANTEPLAEHALLLLGWTRQLTAFTDGASLSPDMLRRITAAGVRVEESPIASLVGGDRLESVALRSGQTIPCEALFVRPAQEPVPLVRALDLVRDDHGFVKVDMKRESSRAGIHVAGDAATMMQSAIFAAAEGTIAGAMINHTLALEDAARALHS